jgi:hypothetical protein
MLKIRTVSFLLWIDATKDSLNFVLVFNPTGGKLEYYYAAAWVQEPGGITTREAFDAYMKEMTQVLDSPLVVEIL